MSNPSTDISLYPVIEPYEHGFIGLDSSHQMYWEISGNRDGVPIVFLHGGPGAGSSGLHRRYFDPEFYKIVIFDQRGSGRSKPFAEVRNNSIQHLIDDIEVLRKSLNIDKWFLFGGSWGSALALAYGIKYPDKVLGFILRGVFLCRKFELDWFLNGMKTVFPDHWKRFVNFLPEDERANLLQSYYERLMDPNPDIHLEAAASWVNYESSCSTLMGKIGGSSGNASGALSLARIEAHYFVNNMFVSDDYFLGQIDRVRHLPGIVVQGRYDMVCPPVAAFQLCSEWPKLDLKLVPDAGHSAMEPPIRSELIKATNAFKKY